jgi:hypothetical protein
LGDVEEPPLSRQSVQQWRQGCQPYALAALYSPETFFSASDTHFCYRLSNSPGLEQPEGFDELKHFIGLTGPQTHDRPACSIVPQATVLL